MHGPHGLGNEPYGLGNADRACMERLGESHL